MNRTIGRRVKIAREGLAYTRKEFARELGMKPKRLRKVEEGRIGIEAAALGVVAKLSGRSLSFLVHGRASAAAE